VLPFIQLVFLTVEYLDRGQPVINVTVHHFGFIGELIDNLEELVEVVKLRGVPKQIAELVVRID
jgi:hypothetical protein